MPELSSDSFLAIGFFVSLTTTLGLSSDSELLSFLVAITFGALAFSVTFFFSYGELSDSSDVSPFDAFVAVLTGAFLVAGFFTISSLGLDDSVDSLSLLDSSSGFF